VTAGESSFPGTPDDTRLVTEAATGSPDESNFVVAANREVSKLIRANRLNRWFRAVLVVVVILLALAVAGLRQQAATSCQSGNSFRAAQTQVWDHFIGILITRSTPPATVAVAHGYLRYVDNVDKPRNCGGIWP
jgi:hypothetical protein